MAREEFDEPSDYDAIVQARARWSHPSETGLQRFQRPGWIRDLVGWVIDSLASLGDSVNSLQHFNGGPTYALLRIETNKSAYWFKAVGKPNEGEYQITCTLAKYQPRYIPEIIATLAECNGWLAREARGTTLAGRGLPDWIRAAEALADLQIESSQHVQDLSAAGARNLSLEFLANSLEPVMNQIRIAMAEQVKAKPSPLSGQECTQLEEHLSHVLDEAMRLRLPRTIGHLDLNPGNVVVGENQCTFLDWAEAYIGNPFFSFAYFLEHYCRNSGADPSAKRDLTSVYFNRWRSVISAADLAAARSLSPLLAVFAYTADVCFSRSATQTRERQLSYLRSLSRRMKRESEQLLRSSTLCPR